MNFAIRTVRFVSVVSVYGFYFVQKDPKSPIAYHAGRPENNGPRTNGRVVYFLTCPQTRVPRTLIRV